jgi:phage portal protein BeeE
MDSRYGRIVTATKSIDLPQWPTESWVWYGGKPVLEGHNTVMEVPWTYRAIFMISQCISDIPFALMRGETDFDTSDDWKNKIGFLPNPKELLWKTAASLQRYGVAYHHRLRINETSNTVKELRYLDPNSITYDYLLAIQRKDYGDYPFRFIRQDDTGKHFYTPVKDVIYFWLPDPDIELGPPQAFPARATKSAANVLHSVDIFSAGFFENGAIKATIMPVPPNMPTAEQERIEKRLKKLITNVRNAFRLIVMGIGEGGKPVVIGEGLEALKDAGAITRNREDITAGYGISLSMLLSSEANYATALEDRKTLYTNTVIPLANFIGDTWNEQIFKPLGYRWVFRPENMEVFQEDENQRSSSLAQLNTALADPELFLISANILGFALSPEVEKQIKDLIAKKEQEKQAMADQLQQKQDEQQVNPGQPPVQDEAQAKEIAQYKRKALNALKSGKTADVEFVSDNIPDTYITDIKMKLASANTEDEVKAAFVFSATEKDKTAEQLLEGIRLGVKALKYDPDQPRDEHGEWTDTGGGEETGGRGGEEGNSGGTVSPIGPDSKIVLEGNNCYVNEQILKEINETVTEKTKDLVIDNTEEGILLYQNSRDEIRNTILKEKLGDAIVPKPEGGRLSWRTSLNYSVDNFGSNTTIDQVAKIAYQTMSSDATIRNTGKPMNSKYPGKDILGRRFPAGTAIYYSRDGVTLQNPGSLPNPYKSFTQDEWKH